MRITPAYRRSTSAAAIALQASALVLILGALAACGGGDGDSKQATAPPTPAVASPPTASPTQISAALRLYESAEVLASLTASALVHATMNQGAWDYGVWTSGPCALGGGSLLASLDGGPVAAGTVLPVGSHTFAVSYANCLVDGLVGTSMSGTASAAYTSVDLSDFTALVSASSMRGTLLGILSDLNDVTSNGSGTWMRVTTSTGSTTTYTPTIGSRLVNNLTTNTATFAGGSYSSGYAASSPGSAAYWWQNFASFAVSINGTDYVLDGSLKLAGGPVGYQTAGTGEVRITSNQTLMARIYGDVNGALRTEILSPLVPF